MHRSCILLLSFILSCGNGQIDNENSTVEPIEEAQSTTTTSKLTTTTIEIDTCIQQNNKDRTLETTVDLQEFLSDYGFYTAEIDGKFGPQTETALRKFQEKAKITIDGKFGDETKKKMRAWTGCE